MRIWRTVAPGVPVSARLAFASRRLYNARLHADIEMPKLKTKSGAKKRFGRTASGKITMNVAHKRHRLISKPKQMKRKARGKVILQPGDAKLVLTYMPYLRS
jgi:large subunit ribosomal protein L35